MSAKRFEGKNLEEALESAAKSFGVERFRVSYHVVLEKRGFLGGTKRVVIEAEVSDTPLPEVEKPKTAKGGTRESGRRKETRGKRDRSGGEQPKRERGAPERSAPESKRDSQEDDRESAGSRDRSKRRRGRGGRKKKERSAGPEQESGHSSQPALEIVEAPSQGEQSEEAEKIARWCEEVFAMSGLDLVARTTDTDEEIEVELFGSDVSMIENEANDLIDSLQVLANKTFTGRQMERRIEFDAGGFKKRREERLGEKARELADRVREEGRERTMRAMTPIERRIVHVTLESESGVTTESRGRGFHKRVAIVPTDEDERAAAADS